MLLAQITAEQWQEWKAFYALDPWGERRADQRNALLGSVIASQHGKAYPMDRFMLYPEPGEQERRDKAKRAEVRSWFEQKVKEGKTFKPKLRWR